MTRSRLIVLISVVVVVVGIIAGLGALWLNPARAAVGPLPGEALILPADARFVMGFDVKRFTASPFYARYASQPGMRPDAFRELEEKTGLNPARDIDQIVVAGQGAVGPQTRGLVMALGRFDTYKLGRAIETGKAKASALNHEGVTVYTFNEAAGTAVAVALLNEHALLFGAKDRVLATVSSRTRGETPLKANTALLALVEKVRPGSTFWMVGDQSLLKGMPATIPAPGGPAPNEATGAEGATITLPALRSLTLTGDLDPQVSLSIVGEAADEAAARNLADVVRGLVALLSLQAQQKPELQQLASAVSVATEANRVLVNVRMPYEMIDALQRKAAPPAPAKEQPAHPEGPAAQKM
jgi:hypothetical protein